MKMNAYCAAALTLFVSWSAFSERHVVSGDLRLSHGEEINFSLEKANVSSIVITNLEEMENKLVIELSYDAGDVGCKLIADAEELTLKGKDTFFELAAPYHFVDKKLLNIKITSKSDVVTHAVIPWSFGKKSGTIKVPEFGKRPRFKVEIVTN